MKPRLQVFCILISTLFCSCDIGFPTDWEFTFYNQPIEGSDLKIISYSAWGGLDTYISGKKIMLLSEKFNQSHVGTGDNFDLLDGIPNKDTIKIIDFDKSRENEDSNVPQVQFSEARGVTVKRSTYSYGGAVIGPCTYKKVTFDNLTESRDSIFFENCVSTFDGKKEFGDWRFPKGNVYLIYKPDSNIIDEIIIELLLLREKYPLICRQSISLKPTYPLKLDRISERGIFR